MKYKLQNFKMHILKIKISDLFYFYKYNIQKIYKKIIFFKFLFEFLLIFLINAFLKNDKYI